MMHRRMADKAKELSKEFEEKFGPLTTMNVTNTECLIGLKNHGRGIMFDNYIQA